ncbi:hypothetical protein FOL47_009232 [Perkinsus chesapeaki]|uniref:Uncharacterized protein n=1 Tax=Perkinsus chesapeaki TaxID=330153 RepID=A0A7J6MT02_PERCH|nr:hypothetical protein FOL47_009232 [Perkinsus chesapeaki]
MEDVGKRVGEALSDEGGIKVCNVTVDTIVFINPNFNEDLTKRVEAVAVEMEPSGLLTEGLEDGMFAALQSAKILHIDQTIDLVKDEDNVMLPAEGKEVNCVETAEEYFLRRMAQVIPNNYGCDSNGLAELDGNDPINKFALWITKVKFGVAEEVNSN